MALDYFTFSSDACGLSWGNVWEGYQRKPNPGKMWVMMVDVCLFWKQVYNLSWIRITFSMRNHICILGKCSFTWKGSGGKGDKEHLIPAYTPMLAMLFPRTVRSCLGYLQMCNIKIKVQLLQHYILKCSFGHLTWYIKFVLLEISSLIPEKVIVAVMHNVGVNSCFQPSFLSFIIFVNLF